MKKILAATILALALAGCSVGLTPRLDIGIGPSYPVYRPAYYEPRPYWGGGWHHGYWR